MSQKKSMLEQALLQMETLEEAVKQNAKGILASTMKQELNDLLKEQEEEDDEENPEEEKDIEGGEPENEELPTDDETSEVEPSDLESPVGEEPEGEEPMDMEPTDEFPMEDEEEPLDLRGASDEEVGKIFKAMSPTDGIIVTKDDDSVEVKIEDDDYIIKLNEQDELSSDVDEYGDEQIYEIELDDEDAEFAASGDEYDEFESSADETELENEPEPEAVEGEYTEAARTKWNPHGGKRAGIKNSEGKPSKKIFKAGSNHGNLNEQLEILKKQNAEYKKALILFKDKLNEVAVFNANLAYATRLFTEHTTTRNEKLNILKRFDAVSTITESKQLYGQIKNELNNKKPVVESVVEKITTTPKTSSSTQILSETKTYENPQFRRMKELMGIKK